MDKHGIDVSVVRCQFYPPDCSHILTIESVFFGFPLSPCPCRLVVLSTQFSESVVGFPVSARSK